MARSVVDMTMVYNSGRLERISSASRGDWSNELQPLLSAFVNRFMYFVCMSFDFPVGYYANKASSKVF